MSSPTLLLICKYLNAKEQLDNSLLDPSDPEYFSPAPIEFPFHVENFCREMDTREAERLCARELLQYEELLAETHPQSDEQLARLVERERAYDAARARVDELEAGA